MRPSGARALEAGRPVFAALADETRLRLVSRLGEDGPLSATRLAAGAGVSRQAVAKHLRVLEGAGLVAGGREGRETVFGLVPRGLDDARRLLEAASRAWDARLGRLRALVEAPPPPAAPAPRRRGHPPGEGGPARRRRVSR